MRLSTITPDELLDNTVIYKDSSFFHLKLIHSPPDFLLLYKAT